MRKFNYYGVKYSIMVNHLENLPEPIEESYKEFKGGCDTVIKSRRIMNIVETARTNGVKLEDGTNVRYAVHVYLKDEFLSVPDLISEMAEKYNLTEARREHHYESNNIEKVSYVRESDI